MIVHERDAPLFGLRVHSDNRAAADLYGEVLAVSLGDWCRRHWRSRNLRRHRLSGILADYLA
ncbi:MAG: hypothetical protein JO358_22650 [Alphaproteobacteria bacterium]|nr:hypothetical protein [Alphaproteobacteria bacterium]